MTAPQTLQLPFSMESHVRRPALLAFVATIVSLTGCDPDMTTSLPTMDAAHASVGARERQHVRLSRRGQDLELVVSDRGLTLTNGKLIYRFGPRMTAAKMLRIMEIAQTPEAWCRVADNRDSATGIPRTGALLIEGRPCEDEVALVSSTLLDAADYLYDAILPYVECERVARG